MRSSPPISGRCSAIERILTTRSLPASSQARILPENLKLLVKEVIERLAGVEGGTPIFRLETGFGGGKSHALIATVHVAREGERLAEQLSEYGIDRFPTCDTARVAAFVGEESDPLRGQEHAVDGQRVRTYTPWGQIALLAGGLTGYEKVCENDEQGIAPGRGDLREALGDCPMLILLDELVLYMARAFALREDYPRSKVNSQWATFFQTLFSIAAQRPKTAVILTLPSEQDANRRLTGELKQFIPTVLDTVDELEKTAARQARNLTPTQSYERAAVLGRRLFEKVNASQATRSPKLMPHTMQSSARQGSNSIAGHSSPITSSRFASATPSTRN